MKRNGEKERKKERIKGAYKGSRISVVLFHGRFELSMDICLEHKEAEEEKKKEAKTSKKKERKNYLR